MNEKLTGSGKTVYVDEREARIGSEGPFFVVYIDEGGEERYGYVCSNCGTLNNAMDSMGRIVCNQCGNTRKAEEWDAAHE